MDNNASPFQQYCIDTQRRTPKAAAMIKVVINACFGGFSLSEAAQDRLSDLGMGEDDGLTEYGAYGVSRSDPRLVQVVEEMGEAADGGSASLRIVEVPADAKWHIAEYDGQEHVAENHRKWN